MEEEIRALLNFIRDRKLVTAALVLLELYRPLAGLGDALIVFSQPFLKMFSLQQGLFEILRSRAKIDWLMIELEKKEEMVSAVEAIFSPEREKSRLRINSGE